MNQVKFRLYQKKTSPFLSRNLMVYGLLILSIIILIFSFYFFKEGILFNFGIFGIIIHVILWLYFSIMRNFEIKPLHGNLDEDLIFQEDQICFSNKCIPLEQIEKIEFDAEDYYQKFPWFNEIRGDLSPRLSNGTKNFIYLYLNSGKNYSHRFEVYYQGEFQKKMKALLIHYPRQDKMHFLNLIESLGIDKYEEIQEFKKVNGI